MTEPTTDELAYWNELHHWDSVFVTPGPDDECRACNETWPCPTTRLLALVAAQAEQIAELEAAAEHWERVMVVVTDQAAEYVATFARVRALCDTADAVDGNDEMVHRLWTVDIRAALDGTDEAQKPSAPFLTNAFAVTPEMGRYLDETAPPRTPPCFTALDGTEDPA